MKRYFIVFIVLCSLFLEGCFNYRDMNRLFFTTIILLDVDEEDNILVYSENFKAYRGQGEKQGTEVRVLFKGKGKTGYAAFAEILESASYEIDYSQTKAIIFTERAARHGIDIFLDAMIRDQKPTLRMFLFVYNGEPKEPLDIHLPDEQFLGLFLDNLMVSQGKIAHVSQMRLDKYLNRRLQGSKVAVIPRLEVTSVDDEKRLAVKGGAVFVNDRMVDVLSPHELFHYNFVIDEADVGILTVENPELDNKYISLKLLKNKTKVLVDYDGERVRLIKDINIKVTILETQKKISLSNDDVRREVKKNTEENMRKHCNELFEKFKEKGIDLYNVQRKFEMKYPHEKVENILEITDITTKVNVFIEGSNDTTDYN